MLWVLIEAVLMSTHNIWRNEENLPIIIVFISEKVQELRVEDFHDIQK